MALFTKRLTCFYCGKTPAKYINGPIANLKFHCEHCDADNYLDQNGEITDPPTEDTNPPTADAPFESVEFSGNELFCSTCLRNQHLYTSSLATFYPDDDETLDNENNSDYEKYRRDLEFRYPQVCETCEPRVKQQMRQAGYEAKADNLRRMMDRTRAFKANQRAREHSWQNLLVYLGSLCYWMSIFGQLAWNITCAINLAPSAFAFNPSSPILVALMHFAVRVTEAQWIPSGYSFDPSSVARAALIMGCISIWWNPMLREKVVGRLGRMVSLAEYYEIQLIFMVMRVIFWSLFKDPSASGIDAQKCVTGHLFMILFTILCVYISRRTIKYEPRIVVDWSDKSWENIPLCSPRSSPSPDDLVFGSQLTPKVKTNNTEIRARFPLEKLSSTPTPASAAKSPVFPTPPPDATDDMDWTPVRAQVIQPTVSVYQRDRPSGFAGPNPFHGSIPPVSKPPAWDLRTRRAQQAAAPVQGNPFHRSPTHLQKSPNQAASPEPVFQPPKFFPQSDYQNDTGLEVMFDRAFSFGPGDNSAHQPGAEQPRPRTPKATPSEIRRRIQFYLLLGTVGVWTLSWNRLLPINGNYVETFALGIASIISGHSLLEALGKPFEDLPGYEIAVNTFQLIWSVYHMLMNPIDRAYFEPLAIPSTLLLLMSMTGQSGMRLLTAPRAPPKPEAPNLENERQSTQSPSLHSAQFEQPQIEAPHYSPTESTANTSFYRSSPIEPPLSFGTTAGSASFTSALPPSSNYQLTSSRSLQPFNSNYGYNLHSPTKRYRNENEYSDYEQDSDTETVASSATNLTTNTNRDIRYGFTSSSDDLAFSPRRNDLTPSLGGLSLSHDQPTPRRMTRSQTQQGLKQKGFQAQLASSRTRR